MSYSLADAVMRNKEFPKTFEIPTTEEVESLSVGDYVKLGFESEDKTGERMWVEITHIDADKLLGTLGNEPVLLENLEFGETINFESKNILQVLKVESNLEELEQLETFASISSESMNEEDIEYFSKKLEYLIKVSINYNNLDEQDKSRFDYLVSSVNNSIDEGKRILSIGENNDF